MCLGAAGREREGVARDPDPAQELLRSHKSEPGGPAGEAPGEL